jgi:hypothetical protein
MKKILKLRRKYFFTLKTLSLLLKLTFQINTFKNNDWDKIHFKYFESTKKLFLNWVICYIAFNIKQTI